MTCPCLPNPGGAKRKAFYVVRIGGRDSDTHAGETLKEALELAMPDPGDSIEVKRVYADDAGWARLARGGRWRRINDIDPFTTGMAAVSLAWNLAVSNELKKIREKVGMQKNPTRSVQAALSRLEGKLAQARGGARKPARRSNANTFYGEAVLRHFDSALAQAKTQAERDRIVALAQKYITTYKKKRSNPTLLLASNPGGKARIRGIDQSDPKFREAMAMFRKFHGDDPGEVITIQAPAGTPKFLVALGRAPEVTYAPPKYLPKGKGPPFMHEWDDPPFLATDASGKYLGYVGMGKGYKITRAGIHG